MNAHPPLVGEGRLPRSRCGLCHIDLDHISVTRGGQTVLQDVDMHIHCGQLTVLIGQNGAGKTTLVRALLGELPHTGHIRHLNETGHPVGHLRTGYVPQHLDFDREMPLTVADFMGAAFSRRPVWTGLSRCTLDRVREALAQVKGEELASRPLGRCSGGEIQRVLLALAMTPSPDLLVLDEPVSGVDQNGLALFLDTVTELKRRHHMAILLVSHDLQLVREYADYVVLLEKTVLCQGAPDYVFTSEAFQRTFEGGQQAC
ncbi:MAG: metal ABC transporter ATP-binding protein [Clostridia bacterium]|nr:metal ABC transporter ATP-binding protein [Clostridia bacterium]